MNSDTLDRWDGMIERARKNKWLTIEATKVDDAAALLAEVRRLRAAAPVSLPAPKLAQAPTPINLIANLLRAGQIVGLDPREMTKNALDELASEYDAAESKNAGVGP